MFDVVDATLNTGIFRPSGHDSVWLFITENKPGDRTQYIDKLAGDELEWQGQTSGRKDDLIITHEAKGLELLVFYRKEKYEFPGAGFLYEGRFRYSSHSGTRPTNFRLVRQSSTSDAHVSEIGARLEDSGYFDPSDLSSDRERELRSIATRRGQQTFRRQLMRAYRGRCAVTGTDAPQALEAAHIHPYSGDNSNVVSNGLLLRADIHTLFDLGLLGIDESTYRVVVAPPLHSTTYGPLHGSVLWVPDCRAEQPSDEAIRLHRTSHGLSPHTPHEGIAEGDEA